MTEIHAFRADGTPSPGALAALEVYRRGYSIAEFGAVGDGVTDDYPAFKAMVDQINADGGGRVDLGEGKVYRIARNTQHLDFNGCDGVKIIGDGVKLDMDAAFHRSPSNRIQPTMPLRFYNCRNVHLEGIEVDGNVDQMTRDPGYGTEPLSAGVYLQGVETATLKDMWIHHWFNDGMFVTASVALDPTTGLRRTTKNLHMDGVRVTNSGRNNMSILYARGITATNCNFDEAGVTGSYGEHNPAAGVDIEPETGSNRDRPTGAIVFQNCTFRDNAGAPFVATGPGETDMVHLRGGEIRVPPGSPARLGPLLRVRGGLMDGVLIDVADRTVGVATAGASDNFATLTYRSCTFRGSSNLYQDSSTGNQVMIEDCDFVSTGTNTSARVPYISNSLTVFRYNRIFLPAAMMANAGGAQTANNLNVDVAEGNRYSTSLPQGDAYFVSAYGGTTAVRHERYLSGSSFREATASVWANPLPVSRGEQSVGDSAWIGAGASRRRVTFRSSAPTSGAWSRGDRVFAQSPSAGGTEGWLCVSSGTPGTWKAFGQIEA